MSKGTAVTGKQKHIPQRTCVVCRDTSAKRALVRLVRTSEEGVQLDPTGKRNGRGAYLCHEAACWKRAIETDILEKALRTTLTVEDRQRLSEAMTQIIGVTS
jgi:uncharacterized protein